jgi:four helix bundle protein
MDTPILSYRDLIVWRKAVELSVAVYALTEKFPAQEQFNLTQQLRKASVSIAANIAEGRHRGTRKGFCNFLQTAYASAAEVESHLTIARRLPQTASMDYELSFSLLGEVMPMLNVMINKLKAKT